MQGWARIDTAPKDGTLLLLIVRQSVDERSCNPTENEMEFRTIGFNNYDNDDVDEWKFAGWNWENDYFTVGYGAPILWQPLPPCIGRGV